MSVSLKRLTEMGTGRDVYVNPEHVVFVMPRNNGSCLRLVGHEYTIEVRETIGHVVAALQDVPFPELSGVDAEYETLRADLVRDAI